MKQKTFWTTLAVIFVSTLFLGIISSNLLNEIARNTEETQHVIKNEPTISAEAAATGMLELSTAVPENTKLPLGASAGKDDYGYVEDLNVETLAHSAFIAGTNVNVTAKKIAGILFGAGLNLTTNAETEYAALAAQSITIDNLIEKDLAAAAGTINISNTAVIGRDAALAASIVNLEGTYYGNVAIVAGAVNVKNARILGDLKIYANEINFGDNAKVYGTFTFDTTKISDLPEENINRIVRLTVTKPEQLINTSRIVVLITSILGMILSAAVTTRFIHKFMPELTKKAAENVGFWANFGRGLLSIIVMPITGVLLLFLPGFQAVGVIILIAFALMLTASVAPATIMMGRFVRGKMFNKKADGYGDTLVGAIISIIAPVNVIVCIAAFGLEVNALLKRIK